MTDLPPDWHEALADPGRDVDTHAARYARVKLLLWIVNKMELPRWSDVEIERLTGVTRKTIRKIRAGEKDGPAFPPPFD